MTTPTPPATAFDGWLAPISWRQQLIRSTRTSAVVAVAFTLLSFALTAEQPLWQTWGGWARTAATSLAYAFCINATIASLFAASRRFGRRLLQRLAGWHRYLYFCGVPIVGLALAMPFASWLTGVGDGARDVAAPSIRTTPLGAIAFSALVLGIFYAFFTLRAWQLRAERQAADARLRLLEAQMEPHFLFNTLANVVGLIEFDPPRAKAMLEAFTDYLRGSLGGLRAPEQSLGDELGLVEAYLRVAAVRMDERLRYRIDVPEALRARIIPALLLQPLVENAIVHGLEPALDGGQLAITARALTDGRLELRVVDDGRGLDAPRPATSRGTRTAVANIRERLRQLHGDAAGLALEARAPHGTCATLTLPSRTAA